MNRAVLPVLLFLTAAAAGCAGRARATLPPLAMPPPPTASRQHPEESEEARRRIDRKRNDLSNRVGQSAERPQRAPETPQPTSTMGDAAPSQGPTSTTGTVIVTTPGPPARSEATNQITAPDAPPATAHERNVALPIAVALALISAIVWVPRWTDRALASADRETS